MVSSKQHKECCFDELGIYVSKKKTDVWQIAEWNVVFP